MKLGQKAAMNIEAVSTGSLSLDLSAWNWRITKRKS